LCNSNNRWIQQDWFFWCYYAWNKCKIKTSSGEIKDVGKEEIQGELLLNSDTMTCGKLDGTDIINTIEIDGKNI
jgi:hypothetical protein